MNAAETIAAAIEKLEARKASSEPGKWTARQSILGTVRVWGPHQVLVAEIYGYGGDEESTRANAELIVTLHRTIDAQLALMRRDLRYMEEHEEATGISVSEYAQGPGSWLADVSTLRLAEAILGGAS